MKRSMSEILPYVKLGSGLVLVALVMLFTIQNVQAAPVRFLFWSVELSLALLIFGTLAVGMITGGLITSWIQYSRHRKRKRA